MTEPHIPTLTSAARPSSAVVATILLLFAAEWLFMLSTLVHSGGINLGFTDHNAIYLLVRNGLVATAVLVAGAVALGRRWSLLVATIVAGLHTLTVFGMAVVQLVLGARGEFLVETTVLSVCLIAILAAAVLGWLAVSRSSGGLQWAGVLIAAATAAVWTVAWFIQPSDSMGLSASVIPFLLIDLVYVLFSVLAAGFVGMPSKALRYGAFGMAAVLALWQVSNVPGSIGIPEFEPAFVVLRALVLIGAAVAAFLAARAISRSATTAAAAPQPPAAP